MKMKQSCGWEKKSFAYAPPSGCTDCGSGATSPGTDMITQ